MILVTSPTTFVGRAVVQRLAAEDFNTRCLIRPSRYEQQLPTEVTFSIASASLADFPALRAAMQGVTAVIHLARGEERLEEQALQDQPLETADLLAAAQEAGVTRFIYL
ncbi:MAG: NAD(P)H-binding protein, partial [Anaerolineae bacterium]